MPPRDYYLPQRKLVSQDDAAMIQRPDVPRSRFTGTWTRKTTFDAGYLVPFMVDEVLPGDHLSYDVTAYVRMATPLFPIFDNQRIDTFFFYVPARILWTNWVKFMGEQSSPADTIDYTVPTLSVPEASAIVGSLYDDYGIPLGVQWTGGICFANALPFRAYNKIWNAWFRDQNVMAGIPERTGDADDVPATDYVRRRRAKAHDYFTSALPWPQKFTAPNVPIAGTAPVIGIGTRTDVYSAVAQNVNETPGVVVNYPFSKLIGTGSNDQEVRIRGTGNPGFPQIFADLSEATGVAINTFRQAFLVQQLLERDARGGTRYVELIRSHFGVTNPDFRLQRPEYIGGGQSPLQITPIAQTAPTDTEPLGALGAAATSAGSHRASYAATEHGYILGLINVRTELSYQHGMHKMFRRTTRYDFYWPALAQLGEQAVLQGEIYYSGDIELDDEIVFGYQERWHEYRTRYSEVTGMFRSLATGSLDAWHLAQEFSAPPVLNTAFLQDDPPMERILAAGELAENQQYLADIMITRRAVRPIPSFGTPVMLGRF